MVTTEIDPARSVQHWLQEHQAPADIDENRAVERRDELSSEVGFATFLYQASLQRLSKLSVALSAISWACMKSRRQLKEIESRFRLFGDSFEHGKLESCLGDEEIHEKVLRFLLGIASALTQGESR